MRKRQARRATLPREWLSLRPGQPHWWWAEVAIEAKARRLRSKDVAGLLDVMDTIDASFHHRRRGTT